MIWAIEQLLWCCLQLFFFYRFHNNNNNIDDDKADDNVVQPIFPLPGRSKVALHPCDASVVYGVGLRCYRQRLRYVLGCSGVANVCIVQQLADTYSYIYIAQWLK